MSEQATNDAQRDVNSPDEDEHGSAGPEDAEHSPSSWWTTRFDRGLSMTFIALLAVSLFTGYVARPRVLGEMRSTLEDSQVNDVSRRTPAWERPFMPWQNRELLVMHRLDSSTASEPLVVESVFSPQGQFLGARSVDPPPAERRRGLRELERVLQIQQERYAPLERGPRNFSVSTFFGRISEELNLSRLEAFELFPARLHNPRAQHGETDPEVIILHIWCSAPGGVGDADQRSCPSSRRLVYPLAPAEDGTYEALRNDMLL